MRLAIADPPYLGRSRRWYGDGRGHGGGRGRAAAHAAAERWDDPETHRQLVAYLEAGYDGWVIAASADSLVTYLPVCPDAVRLLVWHKGNAIPSGSRIASQWEPVIARIPEGRSGRTAGAAVSDVLDAGISYRHNYVGSKPYRWTHWVLDVLGYQPDVDELHDLFAGSGAVDVASMLYDPPPSQQCAACGTPIGQSPTGRRRRTCSDACRRRLSRRERATPA
ncbi:MAG: hypothetical protein R2722_16280 [Tessaracoccus sp.]